MAMMVIAGTLKAYKSSISLQRSCSVPQAQQENDNPFDLIGERGLALFTNWESTERLESRDAVHSKLPVVALIIFLLEPFLDLASNY